MSITRTLAAAVLPLVISTAFAANPPEKRPLKPEDFASLKRVDDPQLAPDGNWIAYTVHCAMSQGRRSPPSACR